MNGFFAAKGAFGLTRGMARAAGIDITEAVVEGWLTRGELAELVDRCLVCDAGGDCLAWLGRAAETVDLPGFCDNKQALEALRGTP